jgi:hypothetical protein
MSVIFGLKFDTEILIAADKRGTSINNGNIDDTLLKINVINNKLAFAHAGNVAIGTALSMDCKKQQNKNVLTVDGLLKLIREFPVNYMNTPIANVYASLIVGGITDAGALALYSITINRGIVDITEAPASLYPPDDVDNKVCCNLLARNLKNNPNIFVERTIQNISELSMYVSNSGDKWVYNIQQGFGKLESF